MNVTGLIKTLNHGCCCYLMLVAGPVIALEPVRELQNQRLFMSAEQRSEIDRYSRETSLISAPLPADASPEVAPQDTPVETPVIVKKRAPEVRLDGMVVRPDGKVFAWQNKQGVAVKQSVGSISNRSRWNLVPGVSSRGVGSILSSGETAVVVKASE